MKLVVLDNHGLNPGDLDMSPFEQFGELIVYPRTSPDQVLERCKDADMIFVNKVYIGDELMAQCPKLKYIGIYATGYNVVDVEAAKRHGIVVTNVPGYSTHSVAQFTIALILAIANRVCEHNFSVYRGDWIRCKDFTYWNYPLVDVYGKTIGLIGFGEIGQAVAKIALAMGMKVLYNARTSKPEWESESCHFVSKEEIYEKSDIISLHCPLFPETKHMINKKNIAKMRDGVWFINTARGGCVVEQDLTDALQNGKIAYAAVDVVTTEPMNADCPYMNAPNMIITPHIAWASLDARKRLLDIAVENVKAFLRGEPLNVVNP